MVAGVETESGRPWKRESALRELESRTVVPVCHPAHCAVWREVTSLAGPGSEGITMLRTVICDFPVAFDGPSATPKSHLGLYSTWESSMLEGSQEHMETVKAWRPEGGL